MSNARLLLLLVLPAFLISCNNFGSLPALSSVPTCEGAPAGTLYVDASVASSGDGSSLDAAFKTVTEAVTAAAADGHICVVPGTYQEGAQVTLDKNLTIEGAVIPADTDAKAILHGEDSYRVVYVDDSLVEPIVTLENLTITNGLSDDALDYGGGIQNQGDLTLLNTAVINNVSTSDSGGIENGGTLVLGSGTRVNGNTAADFGGGIYSESGNLTVKSGAEISGNEAGADGGGLVIDGGTATFESGVEVSDNVARNNGGGVNNSGVLDLTATTIITGNTANASGGTFVGGGIYNSGTINGDTAGVTGNTPDDVANAP